MNDWFEMGMVGLIGLLVAAIILIPAYMIGDTVMLQASEGHGRVADKIHQDAYTTTSVIPCGKIFIPQIIHHPESFRVVISMGDGQRGVGEVESNHFERLKVGQRVSFKYMVGRFSKKIHVEDIR